MHSITHLPHLSFYEYFTCSARVQGSGSLSKNRTHVNLSILAMLFPAISMREGLWHLAMSYPRNLKPTAPLHTSDRDRLDEPVEKL